MNQKKELVIERVLISDLKLDPKNARKHPDKNLKAIVASLDRFGQQKPIVVKGDNVVVAGNGTVEGALNLGWTHIDIVRTELEGQDAADFAIADNRTAELAEWDVDILLETIRSSDSSPEELGWSQVDLDKLVDRVSDEPVELEAADAADSKDEFIEPDKQQDGPDQQADEFPMFEEGEIRDAVEEALPKVITESDVVAGVITRAMAMGQFNRLSAGKNDGMYISALFCPHRFSTGGPSGIGYTDCHAIPTWRYAFTKYIASQHNGNIHPRMFVKKAVLGMNGHSIPNEFRPWLARDLYKQFVPVGGRVLDPCHGWGGRVIGWLAANLGGHYIGFDPSTRTSKGVKELISFLKGSKTTSTAEVHCLPFEDSVLEESSVDFVFTSPPYFDTEKYSTEETNSLNRYKGFDAWVEGFARPLLEKSLFAVKPTGAVVLNVGNNIYPLQAVFTDMAKAAGCEVSLLDEYGVIHRMLLGDKASDEPEPFILIKPNKGK